MLVTKHALRQEFDTLGGKGGLGTDDSGTIPKRNGR